MAAFQRKRPNVFENLLGLDQCLKKQDSPKVKSMV